MMMTHPSINQPIRLWQSLAAALLLFFAAAPAHASVQEMRVLATGVDKSSAKASALALEYAKKRAVYLVARKMQVEDASSKLEKLKDEQWHEIIRGATVLQTRRVGEITYADVSVTVVDEALRRALDIQDPIASSTDGLTAARPLLLLPVFVGAQRPYVWEKENLVNEPVRSEVLRQARGAVLVPAGDFDDRRLIDYQNALDVTAEELKPMFTRYGIDEIVIAIVTLGPENSLEPTNILLRRLVTPPGESRVEQLSVTPLAAKETPEERAAQAAGAVAAAVTTIAGSTSELQQARMKDAPNLPVTFRYATARDLAAMQEAVRGAPGVMQLVMPAIALNEMKGIVYLSGDKDAVRQSLVKQGFIVADEGDGWRISLR